jgi:aminoglycoside phosphotransferase (APT) family kinase protein
VTEPAATSTAPHVRVGPGIDVDRLAEWMDGAALPGTGEPLAARFLSGGTQNVIYELTRGDERCVIRMPPPGAPPDRDKGILREWRIIEALDGTEVPHTTAIGVCDDPAVLGRPFYLMGFVDGWSPMDQHGVWPEPFNSELDTRPDLSYQLAEGIALLSKVDWKAEGLTDLGRPDGFHEGQVDRWTGFFERIKNRELDGLGEATDWLRAHRPLDFIPGLMHGDYQFPNVMYRHGAPARLAAIVDWEMGTVGDPKLDLVPGWCRAGRRTPPPPRPPSRARRHAGHAVARSGGGALRRGVRPSGRRPGLLPGAGQVETGDRVGAGFPARGR